MPLLVPELVDLIVDELRDDTSALRACSMAATVFRSRTRQYLFETIRLSNCSKTLYASFFSVLGSSEPAACVRKLDVRLFRHLDQVDYWSCAHGDQGLIPILGRLERLEELALEGLDWFALDDAQQAQLLAATMLPFLRTLRLRRVLLPGESFVVRLFTSHQRTLQTVEVGDLARGPSEVQASCLASTGVWLVDFLWESSMHWPLTFWLDAFVFSSLVTLDLRVDHDREIQAVQTLLHNVSATLNHLTFRQTAHPESSMHTFDISRLSCLRTFRYNWLNTPDCDDWSDGGNPLHRLLGLISTIASPCFEQAVFDLANPVDEWPDPRDLWLELGQLVIDRKWRRTSRGAPLRIQMHGYWAKWAINEVELLFLMALDYVREFEDVMRPYVTKDLVDIQTDITNTVGHLRKCYELNSR